MPCPARSLPCARRSYVGVALAMALAFAFPRVWADAGVPRAPTAADCSSLAHQFDVAWRSHSEGPHAANARHNRDLGEASCQAGRYADGVHQLRRALHDIGLKPVKVMQTAPKR